MEFTVQNLFDLSIGILGEQKSNSSSYNEIFYPIMNTILSECMENENTLRQRDGMDLLTEAPYLSAMDDKIPYHAELVRNVLPYGIGMLLAMADEENIKATFCSSKYDEHRNKFTPALYVEVEAVF